MLGTSFVSCGAGMDAFLVAVLVGAAAEIGDKSFFFAALLGMRYRQPLPVFGGMALGLGLSLAIAAAVGAGVAAIATESWVPWLVAATFLAMALWMLRDDAPAAPEVRSRHGLLLTAAIGFFVLEMGDKTQLAVIALTARFDSVVAVLTGALLGALAINVPALWLGNRLADRLPMRWLRRGSAVLFLGLGVWIAIGAVRG
jgi:Ca2+/H+ antiporter, TMEM165/GDT1 family